MVFFIGEIVLGSRDFFCGILIYFIFYGGKLKCDSNVEKVRIISVEFIFFC